MVHTVSCALGLTQRKEAMQRQCVDTVGTTETVSMKEFDSLHAATTAYKLSRQWPRITVTRWVSSMSGHGDTHRGHVTMPLPRS